MNIFYRLPKSVRSLIFEFDSTYHEIYTVLRKEFYQKSSFWRIKWLNNDVNYGRGSSYETIKYDSYRHQVLGLTTYWNSSCIQSSHNNATDVFITDEILGGYKKLFDRINTLKKYTIDTKTGKLHKLGNL